MSFKITGKIRDEALNAMKAQLDGGYVRIYQGTVPATTGAAVDSADLLVTISESGTATGINFDTAASGGVISKASGEVWIGTIIKSGTATFYRFSPTGDAGGDDDTIPRLQGTVGVINADLLLSDADLVLSDDQRIDYYSVGMPGE